MTYMAGRCYIPLVALLVCVGVSVRVRGGEEPEGKPGPLEVFRSVAAAVIGVSEDLLRAGDFKGPARARQVRYRFLTLEGVKARIERKRLRWEVKVEEARLAGGKVSGMVAFARDEEGRSLVELDLRLEGISLGEITRDAKVKEYKGKVRGNVKLSVRGGVLEGLCGEGSLYVSGARLAGVPVLAKVLGIMGAPSFRRTDITEAEAHFTLTPRAVVFQALEFRAEDESLALKAERNGVARYDGTLDLVILPVVDARILSGLKLAGELASEVLRALEGRVMRVIVEGSVSEPRISWNPTR